MKSYELLNDFVKNKYTNENTKIKMISIIERFKKYNYSLNNTEKLKKFIEDKYTSFPVKIKLLNLLCNYFELETDQNKMVYDLLQKTREEYKMEDKGKVFGEKGIKEFNEIIDKMDDTFIKLYFILFVNYPNVRLNDYWSIKIDDFDTRKDNYLSKDCKFIKFNHLVKEDNGEIKIKLKKEHTEIFKDIIKKDIVGDYLNNRMSLSGFSHKINKICKKVFGIKRISLFRRLSYKEYLEEGFKENFIKMMEISKGQNHNGKNIIGFYI